ncbi:hypothetical protein WMF30_53455 [Sorangium sp. So ce134]
MSFVHDEGQLRFAFDGDWKIPKWEPALASTLGEALERELTWLNPRVLVTCRSLIQPAPVHGLVVTSLA